MAQAKSYDEWGNELFDPEDRDPANINVTSDFPTAASSAAPVGNIDRQAFQRDWIGSSGSFDDFISSHPQYRGQVTPHNGSKDVYDLRGTNETLDLLGDVGGRNSHEWTGTGVGQNGVVDAPSSFAQAPSAAPFSAPAAAASQAPAPNSFQDQIRQLLLQRLQAMGQTPTASDPIIAGQTEAFRNEQTRSADQQRAAAAERAAANGLLNGGQSSGSFDTVVQGINEDAGQKTSAYQAGLLGNELQSRRATMQQLLQMALQTGDSESARSLEMAIAQMDNQLRQQQLSQQGNQFNASLNQNQSQFNDTLGFNQAQRYDDSLYRNAVLASLGVA